MTVSQAPFSVFIADDHEVVRRGLKELLEQAPDLRVVGEAATGWQVLNATDIDSWDVLLLDLSLPKVSGPEVLRRIKARRKDLAVVVISMYPEDQYAPPLLAAGAHSYVSKDRPGVDIVAAVTAAARGEPWPMGGSAPALASGTEAPHFALTAREHQVFLLVIQGRTVSDIAAELDVISSTVSTHLAKIREKLGVRSIAEIVHYAHRQGLVDVIVQGG